MGNKYHRLHIVVTPRNREEPKLPGVLIAVTTHNLNAELFTNDIKLLNIIELPIKSLLLKS